MKQTQEEYQSRSLGTRFRNYVSIGLMAAGFSAWIGGFGTMLGSGMIHSGRYHRAIHSAIEEDGRINDYLAKSNYDSEILRKTNIGGLIAFSCGAPLLVAGAACYPWKRNMKDLQNN